MPLIFHPSTEQPMQLNREFSFHAAGESEAPSMSGRVVTINGRRLIAAISQPLNDGACVSIDCREGSFLGEVLGTWSEEQTSFACFALMYALREFDAPGIGRQPVPVPNAPVARDVA